MELKSDTGELFPLSTNEKQHIEAFQNTYNSVYIQPLSDEKKRYASKDDVVLQRLVHNLLHAPRVTPPYIEGPYTFYRIASDSLSGIDGQNKMKTFYLFGEVHIDTRGHCPSIDKRFPQPMEFKDYIDALSINTYAFTDLYVELSMLNPIKPDVEGESTHYNIDLGTQTSNFAVDATIDNMFNDESIDFHIDLQSKLKNPNIPSSSYTMDSLLLKYRDCIQPSTRTADKCQLMRIHNIDIRSNWSNILFNQHFYINVLLTVLLKEHKTSTQKINILKRIGKPIQTLLEIFVNQGDILDSIIELFKNNPSIKKEVDKRTYFKDVIEAFIKYKIASLIHTEFPPTQHHTTEIQRITYFYIILKFMTDDANVSSVEHQILDYSISKIPMLLSKLDGLSMDMYALSRMFKFYKPKRGQVQNQPEESTNIIVYAGNTHIQTYREFLKLDIFGGPRNEKYMYENPDCLRHRGSCVRMKW